MKICLTCIVWLNLESQGKKLMWLNPTQLVCCKWKEFDKRKKDKKQNKDRYSKRKNKNKREDNKLYKGLNSISRNKNNLNFNNSYESRRRKLNSLPLSLENSVIWLMISKLIQLICNLLFQDLILGLHKLRSC